MKTLTMRVDDSIYQMIKAAADGQKRNISNFIEGQAWGQACLFDVIGGKQTEFYFFICRRGMVWGIININFVCVSFILSLSQRE